MLHTTVSCHRADGLLGETAHDVIPQDRTLVTKPSGSLMDHGTAKYDKTRHNVLQKAKLTIVIQQNDRSNKTYYRLHSMSQK